MSRIPIALLMLGLLAGSGCGQAPSPSGNVPARQESPKSPPMPMAEPILPQPPPRNPTPVTASIEQVMFSRQGDTESGEIGTPAHRFNKDDSVYARIQLGGNPKSADLYAKWLTPERMPITEYGVPLDGGKRYLVIALSQPGGWRLGRHELQLALNSQPPRPFYFEVSSGSGKSPKNQD